MEKPEPGIPTEREIEAFYKKHGDSIDRLRLQFDAMKLDSRKAHFHLNEYGTLVRCYHKCKVTLKDVSFWLGVTVSFPIEHFIWEKIPGFYHITHFLGL